MDLDGRRQPRRQPRVVPDRLAVVDPELVPRRADDERLRDGGRPLERPQGELPVACGDHRDGPAELPLRVRVPVARAVAHAAERVAVLLRLPAGPGIAVVEPERVAELVDERDGVQRPVDPEPVAADIAVAGLAARAERRQHDHHVLVHAHVDLRGRDGQVVDPLAIAAVRLPREHLLPRERRAGHRQLAEGRLVQPGGGAPEHRLADLTLRVRLRSPRHGHDEKLQGAGRRRRVRARAEGRGGDHHGERPQRCDLKVTTCWKVSRFVQRIVSGRMPEVKRIRSAVASARQALMSPPCFALSAASAASSAAQSEERQAARSPFPQ